MLQGANGKHRHPFFGAVCYRQKDNVIQADVRGPEGFSRYFFNELGYETGLDFKPVKGSGWTYERKRNPNSNATAEVVVHCHNATIELPIEFDVPLGEDGELRIAYLSATCRAAESTVSPDAKRSSARKHS